jgi:hypothetical protein
MAMTLEEIIINETTPADQLRKATDLICKEVKLPCYGHPRRYLLDFDARLSPICLAISQHPNAPPDVLLRLFRICPIEVLVHPLLSLFLLETPDFLEQMYFSYQYVFEVSGLPDFFLEWAIGHENYNIRLALARSPQTPHAYLFRLAEDKTATMRRSVVKSLCKSNQKMADVGYQVLKRFANDESASVRSTIARYHNVSMSILQELARDRWCKVRKAVAQNEAVSIEILELLAIDKESIVRSCVAQHLNTPVYLLEKMAQEQNQNVAVSVANNPNTPSIALIQLTHHKYKNVILAVANNPSTPTDILQVLAQHQDEQIAKMAINNLHRVSIFTNPR